MAAPLRGGDWRMHVTGDAAVQIQLDRVPVVTAHYVFWSENWKFRPFRLTSSAVPAPEDSFTGKFKGVGVEFDGHIQQPADQTLVFQYLLSTEKKIDRFIGGGLEFKLALGSPVTGEAEPELLGDRRGWQWAIGAGEVVTVRFDRPVAKLTFDRGRKDRIRAFFAAGKLKAGSHELLMTVTIPPGGAVVQSLAQRYGRPELGQWHRNALDPSRAPVDLGFLNDGDRPAGRRGFIRAEGGGLVFEDGTPARLWGCNVAARTIFISKGQIENHARRIAALGYNLVRFHHHDSTRWVNPTVIDKDKGHSQQLDATGMDRLDFWIKCLKDEGVYIWLDLHVGRQFSRMDEVPGFEEINRSAKGFGYVNERLKQLMQKFNEQYLLHVNRYTKLAYKDDPAVVGLLITNENDLTHHFGTRMLPDKKVPFHQELFEKEQLRFARRSGFSVQQLRRLWEPGPGKIWLNDLEHRFSDGMIAHLRGLGVRVPVATTSTWGYMPLFSLPSLTGGDLIDVHSYGGAEALSVNPRAQANYISWIGAGQVVGKPLVVSEWNVVDKQRRRPAVDRFTAPMALAAAASLQGWDALMVYNYSQESDRRLVQARNPSMWSTFHDPAMTALMPAAAIAFRRVHILPARRTFALQLSADDLFNRRISPANSLALRTLIEQSRLVVAMPKVEHLPWLKASTIPPDFEVVTDPDRDFLPPGATIVRSDTGQLVRNWRDGTHTIDAPATAAVSGWFESKTIDLAQASFSIENPKATVVVTALDDKPIARSTRILITVVARAVPAPGDGAMLSEPVRGRVTVRSEVPEMRFAALSSDGSAGPPIATVHHDGAYRLTLPAGKGTHWYLLSR